MTITPAELGLLDASLRRRFVPHLPLLLQSRGTTKDDEKNLSRAFAALAIAALCDVADDQAAQSVVDDFDDFGLDAVYHQPSSETLFLVQAKHRAGELFSQKEANAFCQGVRKIINSDFTDFNAHVVGRQPEIEHAMGACSHIKIVVAYMSALSDHASGALDQLIREEQAEEPRISSEVIHVDPSLCLRHLQDGEAYQVVDETVSVESWAQREGRRVAFTGYMPVLSLIKLHRSHGKALYAKNIRQHLGQRTDVNSAIAETLRSAPGEFEYLNNGVTILADRVEPKNKQGPRGKRLKLSGMSVINGAQTIASSTIFAGENEAADITTALVPVTIIQSDHDADFSKRVTRARNHQNQVLAQNFSALDDQQERLRRELALLGVRYVYQPEAADDVGDPNRVDIQEAVQALALAHDDPRFAVYLKREPGQLLLVSAPTYVALFSAQLSAYRLLNAVLFWRHVQERVRAYAGGTNGQERLTYRHGVFALGFVAAKRARDTLAGGVRLDGAKVQVALSGPLDDLRQALWTEVQRHPYRGPLGIFRNATETLPLLDAVMTAHYGLAADPVLPHKRSKPPDPYPVDLFDYLAQKAPQIGGLT